MQINKFERNLRISRFLGKNDETLLSVVLHDQDQEDQGGTGINEHEDNHNENVQKRRDSWDEMVRTHGNTVVL